VNHERYQKVTRQASAGAPLRTSPRPQRRPR